MIDPGLQNSRVEAILFPCIDRSRASKEATIREESFLASLVRMKSTECNTNAAIRRQLGLNPSRWNGRLSYHSESMGGSYVRSKVPRMHKPDTSI